MANKRLKVGFDLDGVILYNPIRTFRPIAEKLKFALFPRKRDSFYIPKNYYEKLFWTWLHKTSYKPAKGLSALQELVNNNQIEAFLITGRYSFLSHDFNRWLKIINADRLFSQSFYNNKNEQPNRFKEKMIKKLKLNIFVEDNWGIIKKLNSATKTTKIYWITNFLDRRIDYPYKFFSLKEVAENLKKTTPSLFFSKP